MQNIFLLPINPDEWGWEGQREAGREAASVFTRQGETEQVAYGSSVYPTPC